MKVENSIRFHYEELYVRYSSLREKEGDSFNDYCNDNDFFFEDRIKSQESYALKLSTGRYDGHEIDDFYACTIVVPNLRYVEEAENFVSSCYEIIDRKPGDTVKSRPADFSFNSIRLRCQLKRGVKESCFDSCEFEVQIKTLLEHAYSKATHDFSYKGGVVSWSRERLAAQIKAVLDNADLSILEMEKLSSSSFLDKKNITYEKRRAIVDFIKNEWNSDSDDFMPSDLKRLAEVMLNILSASNLEVESLQRAVKKETEKGRGTVTKNLSIYSILLQSLINQEHDKIMKYLQGKKQKNKQQILIPPEIELPVGIGVESLKNAIILNRYD